MFHPLYFSILCRAGIILTTAVVGDIYMLAPAYQGRRLFINCSEYSMKTLAERATKYYEHASVHEGTKAVLSSVKNGYAKIVRESRVYEVEV